MLFVSTVTVLVDARGQAEVKVRVKSDSKDHSEIKNHVLTQTSDSSNRQSPGVGWREVGREKTTVNVCVRDTPTLLQSASCGRKAVHIVLIYMYKRW